MSGKFCFNNLQPGTYCLLPGDWTYPAPGIWYQTITLGVGEQRSGIYFGWDYQLN